MPSNVTWIEPVPGLRDSLRTDPFRGPRSESWRVDLMGFDGGLIGVLPGAQSVSLSWDQQPVRSSGKLEWSGSDSPDWLKVTLIPWYRAEFPSGLVATWPLGEFVPSAPSASWSDRSKEQSLDLYDKLSILAETDAAEGYALDRGVNGVQAVRDILAQLGTPPSRIAIPDSPETLRSPQVWGSDSNMLSIINDILQTINFNRLSTDGLGTFVSSPSILDTEKPISFEFHDTEDGVYSPEFEFTQDTYRIPNFLRMVTRGEGGFEGLISEYQNVDNGPFSQQARGRVIPKTIRDVEASNQATLDEMVKQQMAVEMQATATVDLPHWTLPLESGDVISWSNRDARPERMRAVIVRTNLELNLDGTSESRSLLREVVSV